jgi:hypothetical protein
MTIKFYSTCGKTYEQHNCKRMNSLQKDTYRNAYLNSTIKIGEQYVMVKDVVFID